MPWTDYGIAYKADPSNMLAGNAAIQASCKATDTAVTALEKAIRKLNATVAKSNPAAMAAAFNAASASMAAASASAGMATSAITANTTATRASATANTRAAGTVAANTAVMLAAEAAAAALAAQLNAVGAAAGTIPAPANAAAAGTQRFGSSLVRLTAGMFVLHEVKKGLDLVAKAAEKASEHMNTGAEKGLQRRDKAREYANLIGHDEPDDAVMAQLFRLEKAGGLKEGEAREYGQEFRGATPAGLQKGNVGDGRRPGETQEQYEKRVEPITAALEEEGAKFSARIGMDPGTAGKLAGLLPNYGKIPDAAAGAGQLQALAHGMNEGIGKLSVLGKAALRDAASMVDEDGGRVKDMAEMGAIVGVASNNAGSPAMAATMITRTNRLLKKMAVSEDPEIQKLGIKTDESFTESLRKAAPVIAGNGGVDFLTAHDFGNDAENIAAHAMAKDLGLLDKRIAKGREIAKDGPGAMAKNAKFQAGIAGQNRQAEVQKEAGEYLQTAERQRLALARKAAEGQLQAERKIDTSQSNIGDSVMDVINAPFKAARAGVFGDEMKGFRQDKIDSRVGRNLIEAGKKQGRDLEKEYPGLSNGVPHGTTLDAVLNKVGPELEAKGQSALGGASIDAGVNAMGGPVKAGVNAGAPPAAGGGGPQASNADLKPELNRLIGATEQTNQILASIAGGGGRRVADLGPPPDFGQRGGPHRPGSAV